MIIFQNIIWSAEKALFLADFLCHPICCDGFDDVTITSIWLKYVVYFCQRKIK